MHLCDGRSDARVTLADLRLATAILAGQSTAALARTVGVGGGTTMPGRVARSIAPTVMRDLAARLPQGAVLVTGTNGKTTTARLVSHILQGVSTTVVHNRAGANLAAGIASALVQQATWRGHVRGDLGVFEVDEATLPRVWTPLAPRAVILNNLFRDQLDRYGEIDTVASRWRAALDLDPAAQTTMIFNADDPLVSDVGRAHRGLQVAYGIEDPSCGLGTLEHAADARYCYRCGIAYRYAAVYFGHMGDYRCERCGVGRPSPSVAAAEIRLFGVEGGAFTLRTPVGTARVQTRLPGVYNVHNILAASACCLHLGVPLAAVARGIEGFAPAFGRAERVRINGGETLLLLAKNPAGFNEVLRTVLRDAADAVVLIAINDLTADGRDISWLWDVDFEMLAGRARHVVTSGLRAHDMALRLKYAGVAPAATSVEPDLSRALDAALAVSHNERLFVLPTYTAMLQLRNILQRRGVVGRFWEQ